MNDLEAAADKAELTGQIRSFMAWLGGGRKLTQTGRIGLADARHLVEVLGTGDTIDPEIGDRVFKTKSSEELAYLTRIAEWMKAARLVRVTGTRLVPVKKNAALADRPLDLVLALMGAYPRLGKPLFPRNTWRQSLVGDEFTVIGPELLTTLLASQGPCPVDDLKEVAFDLVAARYLLDRLNPQQMDMLRRTIGTDVTIAIAALGILAVVVVDQASDTAELTALGRFALRRLRGMAEPGDPVLQVRITLRDVDDPPVWRQVLIPAAYPLSRVHRVIQAAMGWENYHMHSFQIGTTTYGPDPEGELGYADETKARLADVARVRTRIAYEYDFGDGWEHDLVVEARAVAEAGRIYPACIAGQGACPPEDSGGAYGFEQLKELLAGPPSAERDEMRQWAGGDYDPAHFDLAAANAAAAEV
ncbi:MAG: plasmid pRiA4b ORF-3 family protein [Streptosporangiaceae bacterium]